MRHVGYVPFATGRRSIEARWLAEAFDCDVEVLADAPTLNLHSPARWPDFERLRRGLDLLMRKDSVLAEGPGGMLWAALLRSEGFRGVAVRLSTICG
jgi:hypothetical protein